MAKQPERDLMHLFGFIAWGDFGPLTLYTSQRGKVIIFNKTWPKGPPSDGQLTQRNKLAAAAIAWKALDDSQRAQWELASNRASLCMHGYDLWQHWKLTADSSAIQTLERQTKTNLLPP